MKKIHIKIPILNVVALLSLGCIGNSFAAARNRYEGKPQEELDELLRDDARKIGLRSSSLPEKSEALDNIEALLSAGANPGYRGKKRTRIVRLDAIHNLLLSLAELYQNNDPSLEQLIRKTKDVYPEMVREYIKHLLQEEQAAPPVYARIQAEALPAAADAPPAYTPRVLPREAGALEAEAEVKERGQQEREVACDQCTYLNKPGSVACEICGGQLRR